MARQEEIGIRTVVKEIWLLIHYFKWSLDHSPCLQSVMTELLNKSGLTLVGMQKGRGEKKRKKEKEKL